MKIITLKQGEHIAVHGRGLVKVISTRDGKVRLGFVSEMTEPERLALYGGKRPLEKFLEQPK